MKVIKTVALVLTAAALAIYIAYYYSRIESYSINKDVRIAQRYIEALVMAQERCLEESDRYAGIAEIETGSQCGGLDLAVRKAHEGSYTVEMIGDRSTYEIRLTPSSAEKVVALYADQTGQIRLGTREEPPSSRNVILNHYK